MNLEQLAKAAEVQLLLPTSIPTLFCRNVPLSVADELAGLYEGLDLDALQKGEATQQQIADAAPEVRKLAVMVFQGLACGEDGTAIDGASTDEEVGKVPVALAGKVISACMEAISETGKATSQEETPG